MGGLCIYVAANTSCKIRLARGRFFANLSHDMVAEDELFYDCRLPHSLSAQHDQLMAARNGHLA